MRGIQTDDQAHQAAGVLFGVEGEVAFQPDTTPRGALELPVGRIAVQQFGSHAESDLVFTQPVTFLVGPNGHGKSTIVEGFLWALTGRFARGLDGRGAGVADLVRSGQAAGRVTVHTAKAGDVLREVKAGKVRLLLEDQAVTEPDPQMAIYARLATTEARLRAVCHGATLLDADHTSGKALLLDVLSVRVTIDDHDYTLPQLDAAYEKAFDDRKLAKRERDAILVPTKPDQPAPDLSVLEQRLATYREDERRLIAESAEASGARAPLEASVQRLTRTRDQLQLAIEASAGVHDALDTVERQLADLRGAAVESTLTEEEGIEVSMRREQLVTAGGRLTLLQETVAGVEGHSPSKGCVLNTSIPCKTPAKAFGEHLAAMRRDIETLQDEIALAQPRIAELEATARGRAQAAGAQARQIAALDQERSRLQNRARDRQGDEARLAEVLAELEAAHVALRACGEAVDTSALTEVQARIRKGDQEVLPQARRLVEAWKTYEKCQAAAQALGAKVERLEQLVERLGPKGARVAALEQAMATFLGRLNAHLSHFGCTLAIELDPWLVRVNGRPAVRLSPSERFRVGACLQLAFAEYTGLEVAVIDNADVLVTPAARSAFNRLALDWAMAAPGRQVLIVAAKEDAWQLPPIPGTAVFRVRQDEQGISRVTRESEHVRAAA